MFMCVNEIVILICLYVESLSIALHVIANSVLESLKITEINVLPTG